MVDGMPATHAVFCKRPKDDGWFLARAYESRDAAMKAIAATDIPGLIGVDYLIVECEPV
jgi:hypothetical protein